MKETLHVKLDIEPFRHELQKYGVNMQKEVAKLVEDVILKIDKRTKEDTPVNFGGLRNSWRFKVSPESARILGKNIDLNYAKYVEEELNHIGHLQTLYRHGLSIIKLDWKEAKQAAYLMEELLALKELRLLKCLKMLCGKPLWEQGLERYLRNLKEVSYETSMSTLKNLYERLKYKDCYNL